MQPVTNEELDQFYGSEVSQGEVDAAIARHVRAFDADDFTMIASDNAKYFASVLKAQPQIFSIVIQSTMRQLIADRVSIELFGRHGCVKAEEVKL